MEVILKKEVLSMTQKIALKVEEAAKFTGIGRNTMRDLGKPRSSRYSTLAVSIS